jgi:hypothetical protein
LTPETFAEENAHMKLVWKNSLEGDRAMSRSELRRRVSLWNSLERGNEVSLSLHGFEYYRGTLDDRTADGRTVWVIDRTGDRRLFHIEDDYDLLVVAHG